MDDQLLLQLYHRLLDKGNLQHAPGCRYSDSVIVLIYFLAVVRDRSPLWACHSRNWPLWMRRLACPSYSQLNRRLKTPSVRELIRMLCQAFRDRLAHSQEKFCDGKPLVVGGFSKDPDTAEGRLPGNGWGRGYKVHVIMDRCGAVDAFTVTTLNAGEPTVTRRQVPTLDLDGVLLRGDSSYDSNPLYRAVAEAGGRLIASRKKPGTGLGHHRHHPDRLRAIRELEQSEESIKSHKRHRIRVEQGLAHLTNLPYGLAPLPNFVRRQRRVELWVPAKITLYHLHLILRQQQNFAA